MKEITISNEFFNDWYYDIQESRERYLLGYGGSGSGKSYGFAQRIIERITTEPGHRILCLRKVARTIRDSTYTLLKDIINDFEETDNFTINKSELSFTFNQNGNQIITAGLDDPEKLKSIAGITSIWIEEATELTLEDFTQIDLRLRGQTNHYKQIMMSFNPVDKDHWLVKRFFEEKLSDVKLIKTTFLNNRFIDEQYKRTLNDLIKYDENAYRIYALGEWGELKGLNPFATQYDASKHESKEAIFDPKKQLKISIDFNLNPFAVTFSHIWLDKDGFHCHTFDEASIENGSIQKMVELIKARYLNQLPNCQLTGDAMGKRRQQGLPDLASFYDQLQRGLGLRSNQIITPANPTHENSRADVNYVLYHFPDIKINPVTCPNTCRDMRVVQCDAFGQIIKKNRKDLAQQSDQLDTIRYLYNTFLWDWINAHQKNKLPRK